MAGSTLSHWVVVYEEPDFDTPGETIQTAFHMHKGSTGKIDFEMFTVPSHWIRGENNTDIIDKTPFGIVNISRDKLERTCRRFVREHKFSPIQSNCKDWCNEVLEEFKVAVSPSDIQCGYLYTLNLMSSSESLLPKTLTSIKLK